MTSEVRTHGRRRRWLVAAFAGAAALLVGVAVLASFLGRRPSSDPQERPIRTAVVERTSLAAGFVLSGALGYGTPQELSGGGGVVTKLPEAGQVIEAGAVVMEAEGAPVFLLRGDVPLWRDIGPGAVGVDVTALRDSLAALGLEAGSGQEYDAALSAAIAALYTRAGYAEPIASPAVQAERAAAQAQLDSAQSALAYAQQAYNAAAAAGPSASERVAADNAVRAAQRILSQARAGDCSALGLAVCDSSAVGQAEDDLALAVAQRDELHRPQDLTFENQELGRARAAVTQAQHDLDRARLNTVGPESVLMAPADRIRVEAVRAKLGQPATGPVVTWTQTSLYAHAQLTEAQRRLVAAGTAARLALPDGTELTGRVEAVEEAAEDPLTMQRNPAMVRVTIDDQAALAELGPSSVTISFIQDEAEDTLVVPVTALLVPAEGGYCVERPDGSYVAVKLGLIADTRAQVFSDELAEGDLVVVA
ncbi:MAG: hypothetical protein LBH76_05045 [Propionibacteriaceae bacterium]|jgi:hypothetical protein|nr:hypothetical protein [Propionibacteriaceae bacterium]